MTWRPERDPTVDLRDDEAVRTARSRRSHQRLQTRISAESATFTGTLRDLAERLAGVTLLLADDHDVQGTLLAVSRDHLVLATDARQHTYVRTPGIVAVRADPDVRVPVAQGHRPPGDGATLLERLGRWEAERPIVALLLAGRPAPLRGRLAAVGDDVVSLDLTDDHHPTYLPQHAIRAVMVDRG